MDKLDKINFGFKITAIKVHPATSDNKSQDERYIINIQTDFFGNKYPLILKDRKYIRENYKVGPPIKIQIFEAIKDVKLHNGVPVPFSIIYYEMAADNRSNAKFIDLILEYKEKKLKTYKAISIDSENNWTTKDINELTITVEFRES